MLVYDPDFLAERWVLTIPAVHAPAGASEMRWGFVIDLAIGCFVNIDAGACSCRPKYSDILLKAWSLV
ncbi:hypothetical protein ACUSIJ_06965 [Pseudochelatococcus sp. B33]